MLLCILIQCSLSQTAGLANTIQIWIEISFLLQKARGAVLELSKLILYSAAFGPCLLTAWLSLAWAELFLTTAVIFRPNGPKLTLYETEESDIKIVRDFIMGFPKPGAGGVRVRVQ